MSTIAIEIGGLTKSYDNVKALNGVNIKIKAGEFFGLLGPNGAGKSTLLRILSGEQMPNKGSLATPNQITIGYLKQDLESINISRN